MRSRTRALAERLIDWWTGKPVRLNQASPPRLSAYDEALAEIGSDPSTWCTALGSLWSMASTSFIDRTVDPPRLLLPGTEVSRSIGGDGVEIARFVVAGHTYEIHWDESYSAVVPRRGLFELYEDGIRKLSFSKVERLGQVVHPAFTGPLAFKLEAEMALDRAGDWPRLLLACHRAAWREMTPFVERLARGQ